LPKMKYDKVKLCWWYDKTGKS